MDPSQMSSVSPTHVGADEAALVAGLRAGDEAAFEALVRTSCVRLLAVTRRLLHNEEDARDAVQDALLSAFKSIHTFGGQSRLATWLHRIAINAALQRLRSRVRRSEQPIDVLLPRFLPDGHQTDPAVDWQEPVDARLERQELRDLVRSSIDRLPDDYRTVLLLLRDIEELDTEETARLLGLNAGAVKTRLHRARQALRVLLDPHFREDEP
jgi:RNA polymerase sigma-70 factor (ECF subfamily)